MTILILLILCFLSGLLNSTEDLIKDKYYESIFSKINHSWFSVDSWKNKYIDRDVSKGRKKIKIFNFEIIKPVQITDWWHFSKMLNLTFLFLGMFICTKFEFNFQTFILIFVSGCIRNIGFSLGYNTLFKIN
jgi:hypothetical protein